jgi:hypothetical protein
MVAQAARHDLEGRAGTSWVEAGATDHAIAPAALVHVNYMSVTRSCLSKL